LSQISPGAQRIRWPPVADSQLQTGYSGQSTVDTRCLAAASDGDTRRPAVLPDDVKIDIAMR